MPAVHSATSVMRVNKMICMPVNRIICTIDLLALEEKDGCKKETKKRYIIKALAQFQLICCKYI
jgi:hypothetical protein